MTSDSTKQAEIDYLEAVIDDMKKHQDENGGNRVKHTYCLKCYRSIHPFPLLEDHPKLMNSFFRGFIVGLGILIFFGIVALVIFAILY